LEGILHGVRVVEVSTLIAGPYCAMLLGEFGAEVVKVEDPRGGDPTRLLGPPFVGDQSALFLSVNRNKKSMALDIRTPQGREILSRMIRRADVLVQNLRPEMRREVGLTWEAVRSLNPRIIHCALSAFGEEGPYRSKPATDNIFQGMGGIMTVSGEEGDPPVRLGITPADMSAALFAALGIVLALHHRARTGEGQDVSLSLIDALLAFQTSRLQEFLATGRNPRRTGRGSPFAAPAEFYETLDGYINIAVFNQKFWTRLCRALDLEELADDPDFRDPQARIRNRHRLEHILAERFRQRSTEEWRGLLDREDIPNGPIYTYAEMLSDPQIAANSMVAGMSHPTLGECSFVRQPIRLQRRPVPPRTPPPILGEHTRSILTDLGYGSQEIAFLEQERIISQSPRGDHSS